MQQSHQYTWHTNMSKEQYFWNVNVPVDQQTTECPDFLKGCGEKEQRILSTHDSDYRVLSWPEVKKIISENRIDAFQRVPSELRRYLAFLRKIKREHGSVMQFILSQRLQWTEPLTPESEPFDSPNDLKILYNDWPYGIDSKVVHLVVWTKFELPDDPTSGELTADMREKIDNYVNKTFCSRVARDQVIWFKNWSALKSVHAVEHFHVMMYDPDPDFIREITGNDTPLCLK